MKLSYEDHGRISVLTLSGELTIDQTDTFRRTCQDRFDNGAREIVLNMEHLRMLDSAGLESLLWLAESVTGQNGHLRLVRPDETVRTILRITRLDRRFNVHDSVEAAAKSLR
jgi:anti-sigma B factor antagonist